MCNAWHGRTHILGPFFLVALVALVVLVVLIVLIVLVVAAWSSCCSNRTIKMFPWIGPAASCFAFSDFECQLMSFAPMSLAPMSLAPMSFLSELLVPTPDLSRDLLFFYKL
jgi:hypothetical protein